MSQQQEIGTYYSMNKQYAEGVQKWKKNLFDEGKWNSYVALPFPGRVQDTSSVQRTEEIEKEFLGLSHDTPPRT